MASRSFGASNYAVGGGGVLAYVGGEAVVAAFELVWVDRDGVEDGVLHEGRRYADPRLSPDGERVAVTVTQGANLDVWLLDLRRGTFQPLTNHPGEDFDPVWRPDGLALALASEIGEDRGEEGPALAWIPELGGPTEQLLFTPDRGSWDLPSSWSPDAESLVVVTRRAGRSADVELFTLSGDRELEPLVASPANEAGARISPDGVWLAYVSDESGRNEIWIRPFRGPGTGVPVSAGGGVEPVWSRDSRELFYRSGLDMMVVGLPPGPELAPSRPRRLFTGRFERNLFGS